MTRAEGHELQDGAAWKRDTFKPRPSAGPGGRPSAVAPQHREKRGPVAMTYRCVPQAQRGGLNSPASQPTASVFMGSLDIEICSVRPQVEHSNVRISKPLSPGAIRASAIRRLQRWAHRPLVCRPPMTPCPKASYLNAGCLQDRRHRARFSNAARSSRRSALDFFGAQESSTSSENERRLEHPCTVNRSRRLERLLVNRSRV